MKLVALTLLPLTLALMTACGGNRNAGVGQPTVASAQKQQSTDQSGVSNHSVLSTSECGFPAKDNAAKSLSIADIVNGKSGTYRLTTIAVASRTNFSNTQKSFDFRLSASTNSSGTSPSPRVECKKMAELPQANSKGTIQAPTTISRVDGSLKQSDALTFEIYGKETKLKDVLKLSLSSVTSEQTLASYLESFGKVGTIDLVQISDVDFQLQTLQNSKIGEVSYQTEARYTYHLEK